jgi:hypothetical protein
MDNINPFLERLEEVGRLDHWAFETIWIPFLHLMKLHDLWLEPKLNIAQVDILHMEKPSCFTTRPLFHHTLPLPFCLSSYPLHARNRADVPNSTQKLVLRRHFIACAAMPSPPYNSSTYNAVRTPPVSGRSYPPKVQNPPPAPLLSLSWRAPLSPLRVADGARHKVLLLPTSACWTYRRFFLQVAGVRAASGHRQSCKLTLLELQAYGLLLARWVGAGAANDRQQCCKRVAVWGAMGVFSGYWRQPWLTTPTLSSCKAMGNAFSPVSITAHGKPSSLAAISSHSRASLPVSVASQAELSRRQRTHLMELCAVPRDLPLAREKI